MFEAMDHRLMDPPRIEATPESVTVTLSNRQAQSRSPTSSGYGISRVRI